MIKTNVSEDFIMGLELGKKQTIEKVLRMIDDLLLPETFLNIFSYYRQGYNFGLNEIKAKIKKEQKK